MSLHNLANFLKQTSNEVNETLVAEGTCIPQKKESYYVLVSVILTNIIKHLFVMLSFSLLAFSGSEAASCSEKYYYTCKF